MVKNNLKKRIADTLSLDDFELFNLKFRSVLDTVLFFTYNLKNKFSISKDFLPYETSNSIIMGPHQ